MPALSESLSWWRGRMACSVHRCLSRLMHPGTRTEKRYVMPPENPGTEPGRVGGLAAEPPAAARNVWHARSRWLVHLGLLVATAAALATLQLLHIHDAIHADVGLVFAGLVIVHLIQRRHRIARMLAMVMRLRPRVERELRRLGIRCRPVLHHAQRCCFRHPRLGPGRAFAPPLPPPLQRWHLTSSAALVVYLVVHVSRRWKRIRKSTIR